MASKGIFKAIGNVFGGKRKRPGPRRDVPEMIIVEPAEPEGPAEPEPPPPPPPPPPVVQEAAPPERPEAPQAVEQPPPPPPQDFVPEEADTVIQEKLEGLTDAIQQQQAQTRPLLEEIGSLSRQAGEVLQAGQRQVDLAESIRGVLDQLSQNSEELAKAMQDQAGETHQQTDLLSQVCDRLAGNTRSDAETAGALNRVAKIIETAQETGDLQLEAATKLQDDFKTATTMIASELTRQRKALTWLLGGVVAAMVAMLVALVALGTLTLWK